MKKYIYIFIAVFLVSGVSFSVYEKIIEKPKTFKAKRVVCQTKTITFEKIYNKEQIALGQKLLQSGNIQFESTIWKAKYAQSKLFDHISKKKIAAINLEKVKNFIKNKSLQGLPLKVKFYTRENDSKDPNKKSDNCKLYAGYLMYEFFLDKKLIYKIQTDFMSFKGEDIPNRIECVFNSFLSIK